MKQHAAPYLRVPIERLVGGTAAERDQWMALAAASLSAEALYLLEMQVYRWLDMRYPDDPGALFPPMTYWEGWLEKTHWRSRFKQAQRQLGEQLLDHLEAVRPQVLNHFLAMIDGELYVQRRPLAQARRRDDLADVIATLLAHDAEYQRAEAEAAAAHRRALQSQGFTAKLEKQRLRLEAKIERARTKLDQPHELHKKLYDLLESLVKYQMALQDRAVRNPALADRLRILGFGLTAVMTSVQDLITQLNAQGDEQPTSDELRAQSDRILTLAMEQLQRWQVDTQQEPL